METILTETEQTVETELTETYISYTTASDGPRRAVWYGTAGHIVIAS